MGMRQWVLVGLTACLLAAAMPAMADYVDDLVGQLKPPARFADHVPQFWVKEGTITFDTHVGDGIEQGPCYFVMDGDRHVALYQPSDGRIDLITNDPARAPIDLKTPPRYHHQTYFGSTFNGALYGAHVKKAPATFSGGGKTITMMVRMDRVFDQDATAVNTFVFRVDPVLGYVIDATYRLASREPLVGQSRGKTAPMQVLEFTNFLQSGMNDPWPWNHPYQCTVYTPEGQPADHYIGWANNWVAADLSDVPVPRVPNGGFCAFINTKPAPDAPWTVALTRSGNTSYLLNTCNVWQDQHNIVTLSTTPGADGLIHTDVTFRLVHLPPEITDFINAHTEWLTFGGKTAVMPRLGQLEDFEDQPLPVTTTVRGIRYDDLRLSEVRAHSGKKSVVLPGSSNPGTRGVLSIAPQIPTEPNTTYRIEAWVYVEGENTTADITADLYRASVHNTARLKQQQTTAARSGEGWKKISLEFSTQPIGYDPFVDLRFRVVGPGKAYFDDFTFTKVKPKRR